MPTPTPKPNPDPIPLTLTRAFKAYSGMDVKIAQKCALSDQCVRVSPEGKQEAIDDTVSEQVK